MAVVAITRGGMGDLWRFASLDEADACALVQYGDPILRQSDDILLTYRLPELTELSTRIGAPQLGQEVLRTTDDQTRSRLLGQLWARMEEVARDQPADPLEILRQVAEDRRTTRRTGVNQRTRARESMSDTENKTQTEASTEEKRPGSRSRKFAADSVIAFGKDKEGKDYSPEHNPKRAGSAAHGRFALYKSGMTIAQAQEAGVTAADINWDVKQGFITLT